MGTNLTTVCLVRHGETDWNSMGRLQGREDIELNDNGRAQAKCCADYLRQFHWDVIATSPLKRAKETAQIISGKIGSVPIIEIEDFIERDYGKASGLSVQERKNMFPDGNFTGQEDWNNLRDRAMNALRYVAGKYEGMKIIVISHGGLINSILSAISNGEVGTGKTRLKNGCVNIIHFDGTDWQLELLNHTVLEEKFSYINQLTQRINLLQYYIVRAGRGKVSPDFNIERTNDYPYCVIHYVAEGNGFVICRNTKYAIKPGQIFVLGPNEAHHYSTNSDSPLRLNWIEFSGGDSGRFIKFIIDSLSPVCDEALSSIVNRYLQKIFVLLKKDPVKNSLTISKLIYAILLFLYSHGVDKYSQSLAKADLSLLAKVQCYIDANLNEELNIEKLASIANFSPAYFAKLFRRFTGNTPAKYILERRLNSAKVLLSLNTYGTEDIAEKLGFCNTSHFIRVFKKAEGLTPAEYRQQYR